MWGDPNYQAAGRGLDVLSMPLSGSLDVNYKVLRFFESRKRSDTGLRRSQKIIFEEILTTRVIGRQSGVSQSFEKNEMSAYVVGPSQHCYI
jgi:hypothetical protein